MGDETAISWATSTFNPWWGCTRVSAACDHCYAESFAHRLGMDLWDRDGPRRTFDEKHWQRPLVWERRAAASGEPWRVFCASMADVFEDHPDVVLERARLWHLIDVTPHLTWMLLTKRPQNIARMTSVRWGEEWPPNVWIGTTAEDQRWADVRVPHLVRVRCAVHFVSYEPAIGPVSFARWLSPDAPQVEWIIAGGESGAHARPANPEWFRSVRDECAAAGVSFHFKQWGEWAPTRGAGYVGRSAGWDGSGELVYRVGRAAAGHILDDVEHQAFPAPVAVR